MKVLMFGWEFPPQSSGGLGTACYGLTKGLSEEGVRITFVVPSVIEAAGNTHVELIGADSFKSKDIRLRKIGSLLVPYISDDEYRLLLRSRNKTQRAMYGENLFQEVYRYSEIAKEIAKTTSFDVIHAHDWMTYPAGIKAKKASKKPLVVHVHATEFDRTGDNPNSYVYNIEREGMHYADAIIAVSNYTKGKIVAHYGIPPEKVHVVHNAVEMPPMNKLQKSKLSEHDKIVLFLGRITMQKGPDYFLYAARRVVDFIPNVKFIIAGSGNMEPFIIEKATELGIGDKVLFTGHLSGEDVNRAYRMADLYVMPSVSDPFGISALEAMGNRTPVLVSKQCGVTEVTNNCLKVDFWDIDEMTNKIVNALRYPELRETLQENAFRDLEKISWRNSAKECLNVYNKVIISGVAHG